MTPAGSAPQPDAVVVALPTGDVVFSNLTPQARGRRLLDLTEEFAIFHPDGRRYAAGEWQLARSLASGEEISDEEFDFVAPDGARTTYSCSCSPVYDARDRLVAAVAIARDVTAGRARDARLGLLAALMEHGEDAILLLDADWRVRIWSGGAERMYGLTDDEVIGRDVDEVVGVATAAKERAAMRGAVAADGWGRREVLVARVDGTSVTVDALTVALRDERGAPGGFLGLHHDLTERGLAEKALTDARMRSDTLLGGLPEALVAVDRDWMYTYVNDRALERIRSRSGVPLTGDTVLGRSLWEDPAEPPGAEARRRLREAMDERRVVSFEPYAGAGGKWIEACAYPSDDGLAIYYRDITARLRADRERDRWASLQRLVTELGQGALAGRPLQAVMDEAVALVSDALDSELVAIVELLREEDLLVLRAGVGWRPGAVGMATGNARGESFVGYVAMSEEPVVSDDVTADPRFRISAFLARHEPVSAAGVVVAGRDRPYGVLAAFSRRRRSFSPDDVSFLQAVANVVSGATERRENEQRLRHVRDDERRRMARDLHDHALQELTDALAVASAAGGPEGAQPATVLVPALKRAGEQLRAAIYDLRLGRDGRSFVDLLHELVELQRRAWTGGVIQLEVGDAAPDGTLGDDGVEVLIVVREALVNARRHSGASTVRVVVSVSADELRVEVSDDGVGFAPSAPAAATGIAGMRERIALLGGRLELRSRPGAGTSVGLDVPLPGGEPRDERVRVLLVEDHTAVREALAAMFAREPEFRVVGQAASLAAARTMLADVDVAVIDLGLPDGYGGDLIEPLRRENPQAHGLVLTASLDRADLARAVESGAAGALDKTARLDEVVDAVRRLRAGEALMSMDEVVQLLTFARRRRTRDRDDRRAIESLTARELEVLQALGDGLDSEAIAHRLRITVRTERNHVANILAKLGVHSRLQALLFAVRQGVVEIR